MRAQSLIATLIYTYTADRLRVAQSVDGNETAFAWDWASGVPEMLAQSTNPQPPGRYLLGHETLGRWDGSEWAYYLPDALGSIRQAVDAAGAVVSVREWDPYGEEVGGWQPGLGYTGEWQDGALGLVYLRARWMQPSVGRFIQVDPWQGNIQQPQSVVGAYIYVGNNPVNFTDPTGMWRWWMTGSRYHFLIEEWYEWPLLFTNPNKQLEYPIPGTFFRRPDMFNSVTGDVYEIEPYYLFGRGKIQVLDYVCDLNAAAARKALQGYYPIGHYYYNWNSTLFHSGHGLPGDWPGKFRHWDPLFPYLDIVADYYSDGVILYWHEPNLASVPVLVAAGKLLVPNIRLFKPRNWSPGQSIPQPAYVLSLNVVCGYALVVVGGFIILVTIVEDLSTLGLGTWNDAITVPAGILLIAWGTNQALLVPVQEVGTPDA